MRPLLSTRLLRSAKVASAHWQRRALFLTGGITVGAAAVGLALAADWVQTEFTHLVTRWRYTSLLVTPLGFALSEGVIDSCSQCRDIEVSHHGGRGFEVRLEIASSAFAGLKLRRRSLEGRTGCGLCGLESLEQLDLHALPRRSLPAAPLAAEVILRAFQALPGLATLPILRSCPFAARAIWMNSARQC